MEAQAQIALHFIAAIRKNTNFHFQSQKLLLKTSTCFLVFARSSPESSNPPPALLSSPQLLRSFASHVTKSVHKMEAGHYNNKQDHAHFGFSGRFMRIKRKKGTARLYTFEDSLAPPAVEPGRQGRYVRWLEKAQHVSVSVLLLLNLCICLLAKDTATSANTLKCLLMTVKSYTECLKIDPLRPLS